MPKLNKQLVQGTPAIPVDMNIVMFQVKQYLGCLLDNVEVPNVGVIAGERGRYDAETNTVLVPARFQEDSSAYYGLVVEAARAQVKPKENDTFRIGDLELRARDTITESYVRGFCHGLGDVLCDGLNNASLRRLEEKYPNDPTNKKIRADLESVMRMRKESLGIEHEIAASDAGELVEKSRFMTNHFEAYSLFAGNYAELADSMVKELQGLQGKIKGGAQITRQDFREGILKMMDILREKLSEGNRLFDQIKAYNTFSLKTPSAAYLADATAFANAVVRASASGDLDSYLINVETSYQNLAASLSRYVEHAKAINADIQGSRAVLERYNYADGRLTGLTYARTLNPTQLNTLMHTKDADFASVLFPPKVQDQNELGPRLG